MSDFNKIVAFLNATFLKCDIFWNTTILWNPTSVHVVAVAVFLLELFGSVSVVVCWYHPVPWYDWVNNELHLPHLLPRTIRPSTLQNLPKCIFYISLNELKYTL